jgi:hypothetical protein
VAQQHDCAVSTQAMADIDLGIAPGNHDALLGGGSR